MRRIRDALDPYPYLSGGSTQPPPTLLLHICCGPCAADVIDRLRNRYHLIAFFFNPNIHPEEEFDRRLVAAATVCRISGVALWVPANDPGMWIHAVRGTESAPEGGGRCRICFSFRLACTAAAARQASIPWFATTLTTSPHKDARVIHGIGEELAVRHQRLFLAEDFKKGGGFQESVRKSRQWGLYRQRYCGCRFSH